MGVEEVSGLAGSGLVLRNNGKRPRGRRERRLHLRHHLAGRSGLRGHRRRPAERAVPDLHRREQHQDVGSADITTVTVSCVTNPLPRYTIGGGFMTGLSGTGLVLRNNGGDDLAVASSGTFTFATSLTSGSGYAVTIASQPSGQTCSVSNGSGTVSGANVTSVSVTCVTNPPPRFTIGGTVTGLTGTGLVLRNNGGDDLAVALLAGRSPSPPRSPAAAATRSASPASPGARPAPCRTARGRCPAPTSPTSP